MREVVTRMRFVVTALRADAHGNLARRKDAAITLDTGSGGRPDAFNPAELLLAALAACMIKGTALSGTERPATASVPASVHWKT